MNVLDYIEKMKEMYEGPRITAQEPRIELAGGLSADYPLSDLSKRMKEAGRAWRAYKGSSQSPKLSYSKFFKLWAKENMAEGGRIGLQGGQLVQPERTGFFTAGQVASKKQSENLKKVKKFTTTSGPQTGRAIDNPVNYKKVKSALNQIKKQRNKKLFFDWKEGDAWYKKLSKDVLMDREDLNKLLNKVVAEEFPGSYAGKAGRLNYAREMTVKSFLAHFDNVGMFDGNEKFSKILKQFEGVGEHRFENINRYFKQWRAGKFEVDGVNRKNFDSNLKKSIKNWKASSKQVRSLDVQNQLIFLNKLNNKTNLNLDQAKALFKKEFPNAINTFDHRLNQLTMLKRTGEYVSGADTASPITGIAKGDRAKWLKEGFGLQFQGNYSKIIRRADQLSLQSDKASQNAAKRLYAAADKYFGPSGIFTKAAGEGEHPFSRVMGSGKIGNQLKINSLISGDLNQFKRINFDMPVIKLFNEYNNKNTSLERRNAIKFEIENRKKLMNYLTESPTEKGIVDSVEFRYQPNRLSASVIGVEDIDKVKNFNIEDYVQRGESYKEAFISKGKQLGLVEDGAIIKQDWNKIIKSSKAKTMAKALQLAGISICSGQLVKKASGGRTGFAEPVCGMEFVEQNEDAFMKKAAQSDEAAKLFRSGNITKHLKNAKNWARANLGPAGIIGGELLFMGLGSAWEMSQGKGWKEALDEWTGLGGHFGQAEARLKEIGKELGYSDKEIYNAMKIGQLEDLSTEYEDKLWKLEGIQEKQDIGGTARYKADPSKRFIGERGYVKGKYQDPRSVRQLKAEIPEIAKKGESLYISLADMPTSANIYGEITRAKALEEKEKKSKIADWLTRNKILAEQNWQPQMQMAGGGLANLTRTVAPDSGPMSQGLRSLYIDDMDY